LAYGEEGVSRLEMEANSFGKIAALGSATRLNFKEFCRTTPVEAASPDAASLIVVNASDTVESVLNLMIKHNITSVPVVNADGVLVDLVGFHDVAELVLKDLTFKNQGGERAETLRRRVLKAQAFARQSVSVVVRNAGHIPVHAIAANSMLSECIYHFARGLHHCVIVDEDRKPVGLVSQSSILRLATKVPNMFTAVYLASAVAELNLGSPSVRTVPFDATARQAIEIMVSERKSALAVVSQHNAVVGMISLTDVKLFQHNPAENLLTMPVLQFCSAVRMASVSDDRVPVIALRDTATLQEVLLQITSSKIHRLFVVDENQQACRIISLTDLIHHLSIEE
jgi:CBS-domain-containing membrane protein